MNERFLPNFLGQDVKNIGIFGLGKSNIAMMRALMRKKKNLKFTLRQDSPPKSIPDGICFERLLFGENAYNGIDEDALVLSPSVRRDRAELSAAAARGCRIFSDAEYYFAVTELPTYAITGSDGKSTVTYLTSKLTERELFSPPAGNFGLPLCELFEIRELRGAVIELSSFQLQYIKPKTRRAVITNITENHLNWHKDFNEYIGAKENILSHCKERILFLDGICESLAERYTLFAAVSDKYSAKELARRHIAEHAVTLEDGKILFDGNELIPVELLARKEDYNVKNFMCAVALANGLCTRDDIYRVAEGFTGLAHRAQRILEHRGVTYIDSSIDSTPERTARTLASLGNRATVIIGGAAKGLSYEPLVTALSSYAKSVILTGASAKLLYEYLYKRGIGIPIALHEDFDAAVEAAVRGAEYGDTVILSPAHTSYDRFSNFEERGKYFYQALCKIIGKATDGK